MADFQKFNGDESLAGPARMATITPRLAVAADPTGIADIMDANYDWVTNPIAWVGVGATNGGIRVTSGHTEFEIAHDLSEHVRTALNDTSLGVETNLAETGDIEKLKLAWLILADATTVNVDGDSYVGMGARRVVTERSLVVVHCDQFGKMRAFYFRLARNVAGDSQLNLASGALQEAPFNLRAFKDFTAPAGSEYGGIWTEDGYAGIAT